MSKVFKLAKEVIRPGTDGWVLIGEGVRFTPRLASWLFYDVGIEMVYLMHIGGSEIFEGHLEGDEDGESIHLVLCPA